MSVAGCSVGRLLCVGLVKRCGSDLGRVFCFRVLWILVFRLVSAIGGDGLCGLVFGFVWYRLGCALGFRVGYGV